MQPVCTTEIGRLALKYDELKRKGVKLATLSADPVSYLAGLLSLHSPTFTRAQKKFVQTKFSLILMASCFEYPCKMRQ